MIPADLRRARLGRGIYNYKWQKAGKQYLLLHPLCVYCLQQGKLTPATVVDHITPHRGNEELFWDEGNWQALCKPCHDSVKQQQEKNGIAKGCDAQGNPFDPSHHWNR